MDILLTFSLIQHSKTIEPCFIIVRLHGSFNLRYQHVHCLCINNLYDISNFQYFTIWKNPDWSQRLLKIIINFHHGHDGCPFLQRRVSTNIYLVISVILAYNKFIVNNIWLIQILKTTFTCSYSRHGTRLINSYMFKNAS